VGTDSSVIAGIELAIHLKNQYNIRVMNLSARSAGVQFLSDGPAVHGGATSLAGWNLGGGCGWKRWTRTNSQGNSGYGTLLPPVTAHMSSPSVQ